MKTTLGAGLAATIAQVQGQEAGEKADKNKLGWAVVGLGGLSRGCIGPALLKTNHAHMAGVVTGTPDKGQFGMTPCFGTQGQKGWTSNPKSPLDFPQTDHFQVQMDLFSKAIMEGKESKVSGAEGLKDHLVMEAIFKSIASGKAEAVGKV